MSKKTSKKPNYDPDKRISKSFTLPAEFIEAVKECSHRLNQNSSAFIERAVLTFSNEVMERMETVYRSAKISKESHPEDPRPYAERKADWEAYWQNEFNKIRPLYDLYQKYPWKNE